MQAIFIIAKQPDGTYNLPPDYAESGLFLCHEPGCGMSINREYDSDGTAKVWVNSTEEVISYIAQQAGNQLIEIIQEETLMDQPSEITDEISIDVGLDTVDLPKQPGGMVSSPAVQIIDEFLLNWTKPEIKPKPEDLQGVVMIDGMWMLKEPTETPIIELTPQDFKEVIN